MPYYCTVPRCTSMAGKAKNVSFHQFPRDEELAKLWNKILKRGKPYTKYSKVCSLHFTAEDYTITSVGKNKGQWRTLRKDAVPSQNLPSESPTPYQRRQWGSWSNSPPNLMDPTIQQQLAQAIYMQTMLAMQAAGAAELPALNHSNGLPLPLPENNAQTSSATEPDILKGKQINTDTQQSSYKCTECSKCFKDPDVYILHKRTHIKDEKNEKENCNLNVTLQANPILANMLKTNTETSNIFDNNLMSMESLLMTALAANMEGYMRNLTSVMKTESSGGLDHDRNEADDESNESNQGGESTLDQEEMSSTTNDIEPKEIDFSKNDSEQAKNMIKHNRYEKDMPWHMPEDWQRSLKPDLGNDQTSLTDYSTDVNYNHNNLDLRMNKDCQDISKGYASDENREETNYDRNNFTNNGQQDYDTMSTSQNGVSPVCDINIIHNSIMKHFRNNTNVRYFENNDLSNGSTHNEKEAHDEGLMKNYKVTLKRKRSSSDYDENKESSSNGKLSRIVNHKIIGHDIANFNDYNASVEGPNCDSDFNESIDSNRLVIDENA